VILPVGRIHDGGDKAGDAPSFDGGWVSLGTGMDATPARAGGFAGFVPASWNVV
jgi:hypothetical protein